MVSLDTYGKIIRKYEGDGFATLDSGQICKCIVRAVQLADGEINSECLFTENVDQVLQCWQKNHSITSITGITDKNDEFMIDGHIFITNFTPKWEGGESTTISLVVRADSLRYKKAQGGPATSVRFGVTNFEFLGNKRTEYPNGGGAWNILSVEIGDKNVEIHEIQDHKNIMKSVKAQKGIDVTSEAIVYLSSPDDLDTITPIINTLCELLSLARGTKINWIYYDCYDEYGEKVTSFHRNSIVWQYAGLPLIDYRNFDETAAFIKQAYVPYLTLQDKFLFEKSIEAYLDAKREGVYLETRALVAAVLLDFLSSRFSNKTKFRERLETMFLELGITVTSDYMDRLKNIRNSLAHEASFIDNISKEHQDDYYFLIGTLDHIFLKIIKYNGVYLDIMNRFERVNTSDRLPNKTQL